MSTFSKVNFKTINYNSFRPHYPPSFYTILTNYVTKGNKEKLPISKAVDLGCGTGVATYPLLNFSQSVTGLDLSPLMVETANSLVSKRCKEMEVVDLSRINFKSGAVEDLIYQEPREIPENSVDLLTAAQCIHWFKDYDSFFANSAKLLKSGGTLAYFFYIDPIIVDFSGPSNGDKAALLKKSSEIYQRLVYEDPQYIGPHWEQPGRSILTNFCTEVNLHIPTSLYEDIEINTFTPVNGKASPTDLDMKKEGIPLSTFIDYLSTYSGFHNFKDATGDKVGFLSVYLTLLEEELGWDRNSTTIDLVWKTGYTAMRKI